MSIKRGFSLQIMQEFVPQPDEQRVSLLVDLENTVDSFGIVLAGTLLEKEGIGGDLDASVSYAVAKQHLTGGEHLAVVEIDKGGRAIVVDMYQDAPLPVVLLRVSGQLRP